MSITVKLYKVDKRTKSGKRYIRTVDHSTDDIGAVKDVYNSTFPAPTYSYEIIPTYTMRKNLLTGVEYMERTDTPNYCSPSSESYWSM